MKMYVLGKKTYGDFDMPSFLPMYVSGNREALKIKAAELNATRSKDDLRAETSWELAPQTVTVV